MSNAILGPAIPQLPAGDIDVAAEFVERGLGFEIVTRNRQHGLLIVRRGPAEIHLWQAATERDARALASQSSCYIRVENIAALYDEYAQRINISVMSAYGAARSGTGDMRFARDPDCRKGARSGRWSPD